jgi:hypothetical protein
VLILAYFIVSAVGSFSDRPVAVVVLLLPLLIAAVVLGLPLVRDRRLVLGGGFLPFFVAYCLLFSIAAGTRILESRRAIVEGFEADAPSNVLGLSRLGDWHYWLAPRAPPAHDIVVVTLPSFSGDTLELARRAHADLIARALSAQAKGIAFDYTLEQVSAADRALCFWIGRAEAQGIPVVYGYRVDKSSGTPIRVPLADAIADCVPPHRLGALTGLLESDHRVRMVPTSHLADSTMRSFSWRIAALLSRGDAGLPRVGLVQYVAPENLRVIEGVPDVDATDAFRDSFVIVGSNRAGDIRETPFGPMPGVSIHALAAHALREGHIITRIDARWLLPATFILCWVLTLLQAKGGGVRPLLLGSAIFSAAILASAAMAIRAGLLWVDVSYPLLAVWGMTAVLWGGARLQRGRTRPLQAAGTPAVEETGSPAARTGGPFDVFVSHNSRDKPAVIELGEALRARGLRVWLDAWELVPGRPWQEAVEEVISTVATAAVVIGRDGIGPWEEPEMRACLDQCVQRKMPVIPVLLPGAGAKPKLPLFLAQVTWVDLRDGLTDDGLDRLEWGVTGIRPVGRPAVN